MTREETQKILSVIDVTFPNFKADNLTATVDAWHFFLADYRYEDINAALKIFVSTANSGFAPSPSQLIGMINKTKELSGQIEELNNQVDVKVVWGEIRNAIRNSGYHAEEEFEKLSDVAKSMVGRPGQLHEWSQLESSQIDTVIASNFEREFERKRIEQATRRKRQAEYDALPAEVKQMLSAVNVSANQIEKASQGKLEG